MIQDGLSSLVVGRAQQRKSPPAQVPKGTRFLVVHENKSVRKFIKGCLQEMGLSAVFELVPPGNILSAIVEQKVHVLIVGGETPEMQEWHLVRALRDHPEASQTKVTVVSGNSDKESILGAVQVGVDDYLILPFSASVFEERIRALFDKGTG